MVTLLLPEGCAGDSGMALPGQGAVHGPGVVSERAAQVAGGAVRSRRWGAGCLAPLAAARALWSSGPGERGKAGGGPNRGGPLGQDPPFAGKSGGGRNRERGPPREQRPDRTGVRWTVGRGGWALGRVEKGRDKEGV